MALVLAVRATDLQIAKLRRIIEDEENLTELTTAAHFQANRNIITTRRREINLLICLT